MSEPNSLVIHLLNGDALKQRFPATINGEQLVMRECLIDGPSTAMVGEKLFQQRAEYLKQYAVDNTFPDYFSYVVPTFTKLASVTSGDKIYCWFEHDLFCQCNLWFCLNFLATTSAKDIYLVTPNQGNEYSFANMSDNELTDALDKAVNLTVDEVQCFAQLWLAYAVKNYAEMTQFANALGERFSFVQAAVNAELARTPDSQGLGKPERVLREIISELSASSDHQTAEFGAVFRKFSQQMGIYGFGDLQVKAMYEKIST
ncbi:hypothetical protein [Thalassotalea montiporae]